MIRDNHYIANYPFPAEKAAPYFQFTINDIHDGSAYYTAPPHAHTHAYFEIFLVEKGGGQHTIDEVAYTLEDRSVHILQPGVPHYMILTKETRGCVIIFSLDVLAGDTNTINDSLISFFRSILAKPTAQVSARSFTELMTIIGLMKIDKKTVPPSAERNAYIRSLFAAFLLTLKPNFTISHKEQWGDSLTMMNKFHELVNKYYHEGLPIADYAAKLGTTEKTLTRAVKKHSGETPAKVIRERVMIEAARLLQHTTYSVKEIAYHLHFSDPAHFVKVFRAAKKCTPLEYRKAVAE